MIAITTKNFDISLLNNILSFRRVKIKKIFNLNMKNNIIVILVTVFIFLVVLLKTYMQKVIILI